MKLKDCRMTALHQAHSGPTFRKIGNVQIVASQKLTSISTKNSCHVRIAALVFCSVAVSFPASEDSL